MMKNWFLENEGKRLKVLAAWLVSLAFVGSLAYLAGLHFNPKDPQWGQFLPARMAGTWINLGFLAGSLLILEWITKGNTVKSITAITCDSPWQEKAVAAGFFVGIALVVCMAVVWTRG